MAPDGDVKAAARKLLSTAPLKLFETIEGDHRIRRDFFDSLVDGPLGRPDALVDRERHRFPNGQQLLRPRLLPGKRQLHAIDFGMPSQQGRELGERRPGRRRLSGPELVEGLGRRDAWGKLDGDEQSDLGVPRERDAEPGIDAVLANQRYTAGGE